MKLVVILIVFSTHSLFAWTVKTVLGSPNILTSGTEKILKLNDKVNVGDTVVTGSKSKVLLQSGETKIWIGANTKFKIGAQDKEKKNILDLINGKIRVKSKGDLAKKYVYKTKTAVAGVRGTEFFIQSGEKEFFCTLEGEVAVSVNSTGKTISVPAGKGLDLTDSAKPKLNDNNKELVDLWVSQTTIKPDAEFIGFPYTKLAKRRKLSTSSPIWSGVTGWVSYCKSYNSDFDKTTADDGRECRQGNVSPFIEFGDKVKYFFQPSHVFYSSNNYAQIDSSPKTTTKSESSTTIYQAYSEFTFSNWKTKIGLQEIDWHDGVIFSNRSWSPEPVSHLGLTLNKKYNNLDISIVGTSDIKDKDPLQGHTHISTYGFNVEGPFGNIYLVNADFGKLESNSNYGFQGHNTDNLGYYISDKKNNIGYTASYIYQKHNKHATSAGSAPKVTATMGDLSINYISSKLRYTLRALKASEAFLPTFEDYYSMGISGYVSSRNNLTQIRPKVEWQFNDKTILSAELLDTKDIGTELDLVLAQKINTFLNLYLSAWNFKPSDSNTNKDDSYGLITRIDFSF